MFGHVSSVSVLPSPAIDIHARLRSEQLQFLGALCPIVDIEVAPSRYSVLVSPKKIFLKPAARVSGSVPKLRLLGEFWMDKQVPRSALYLVTSEWHAIQNGTMTEEALAEWLFVQAHEEGHNLFHRLQPNYLMRGRELRIINEAFAEVAALYHTSHNRPEVLEALVQRNVVDENVLSTYRHYEPRIKDILREFTLVHSGVNVLSNAAGELVSHFEYLF